MHTMIAIDLILYTSIALFYAFVLGVWALAAYELFYRITR